MLAKTFSAGVLGIDAFTVEIETDISMGLPGYSLVGLPDSAVREGSVRVRAALDNSGFPLPPRRVTVNLAPADVKKDGAAFDLPIALALLASQELLDPQVLDGLIFLGELGLDGKLRRILGSLPIALHARRAGFRGVVLPASCVTEAAAVSGLTLYQAESLREVVEMLRGQLPMTPFSEPPIRSQFAVSTLDLKEVSGNEQPRRALEIAAAGNHNLLFMGPPGSGKSMLARRLPSILPPLCETEALHTTAIYSAAGLLAGAGLISERPFRSPHHDVSLAGLIGGGPNVRPGEISLAHNGVLFLDELPEFRRPVLESLRQPLEERQVTLVRARAAITYPASFMLIGAMNPCPCGYYGSLARSCTCDLPRLKAYRGRLSGPLLDRFDLHVEVPHVDHMLLLRPDQKGESSTTVRQRVQEARGRQLNRVHKDPRLPLCNAALLPDQVLDLARPDPASERLLCLYAKKHALTSRGLHRVLRVARTIADLENEPGITKHHVAEALSLRVLDAPLGPDPVQFLPHHQQTEAP